MESIQYDSPRVLMLIYCASTDLRPGLHWVRLHK